MAHYDLHEQEQISNLKYIWQKGGKYIAILIILAIIAYLANVFWNWRNESKAASAAVVYANFEDAVALKDMHKVMNYTSQLHEEYPATEYSAMASLEAAKLAWQDKNTATTSQQLNWVIDNAKDKGLVSVARLRLADVYIDNKQFDKAMQQLLQPHEASFDVLYYTKRGDLYVAKGQLDRARDAYKEAIRRTGQNSDIAQSIQLRLDVLGNG